MSAYSDANWKHKLPVPILHKVCTCECTNPNAGFEIHVGKQVHTSGEKGVESYRMPSRSTLEPRELHWLEVVPVGIGMFRKEGSQSELLLPRSQGIGSGTN